MKEKKLNKAYLIIGIVASAVAIIAGLVNVFDTEKSNITNNGDGVITVGDNNTIVNMVSNPSSYSISEILSVSNTLIETKKDDNYVEAAKLLSLEKMSKSKEAMCNLGYLYAHGYGVSKDIHKAESLYIKSYEAGCNQALINRFVLYVNNIARTNDYEGNVYLLLNNAIKDKNNPLHSVVIEKYGDRQFDVENEDLRHTQCEFKLDAGREEVESRPVDTWRIRWYWISNTDVSSSTSLGRFQTWGYDERICSFDELFKDELAKE